MRVVAFGGGTGLPIVLRGIRATVGADITAVVTVADDGGSSGRLREELGVAPPGDIRNCLVALARRNALAELFNYRFAGTGDLRDHAVGNLIIAALADMAGSFCDGVEQAASFLRIEGRVYPATTECVTLVVTYTDGTVTRGESSAREVGRAIHSVALEPPTAKPPVAVFDAIAEADVVVLAPGSLFTSTIPSLLGTNVIHALASARAPVIYAANLMTEPGETSDFTLLEHLQAISRHVGPLVTDVLIHSAPLPAEALGRYEVEGSRPVAADAEAVRQLGLRLHESQIVSESPGWRLRHNPERLARALIGIAHLEGP